MARPSTEIEFRPLPTERPSYMRAASEILARGKETTVRLTATVSPILSTSPPRAPGTLVQGIPLHSAQCPPQGGLWSQHTSLAYCYGGSGLAENWVELVENFSL